MIRALDSDSLATLRKQLANRIRAINFGIAPGPSAIAALAGILVTLLIALWPVNAGSGGSSPALQTLHHLLLTLFCVVVAAPLFAFGWGSRGNSAQKSLLIGSLFGAGGVLNLAHALSLPGMPGIGGAETPTMTFGIAAQMLFGLALLLCGLQLPPTPHSRPRRYAIVAAVMLPTVAFVWLMLAFGSSLALAAETAARLAYVIAGVNLMALIAIGRRLRHEADRGISVLAAAAFIATLGQLLAAYGGDRAHLGSHLYALLAALCVCRTAYLRTMEAPYARLEKALPAFESNRAQLHVWSELSSDCYWEQDQDFRFTKFSWRSSDPAPSVSEKMLLGKTRWELPFVKISAAQWQAHRALLEAHQPFDDFEITVDVPGFNVHVASLSGRPVIAADGTFVGYRGVSKDITARKQAENLLRAQAAELRQITDGIPASICHFDRRLHIKFANREFANRRSLPIEQVIDQNLAYIYDFAAKPHMFDYCRQALNGEEVSFTQSKVMADGTSRVTRTRLIPERDDTGAVIGIFSLGVDITDLSRAESDIRRLNLDLEQRMKEREFQHSMLQTQLETSLDAIALVSDDERIIFYNRNFVDLFGIPEDLLAEGTGDNALQVGMHKVVDPSAFLARVRTLFQQRNEKSRDKVHMKDGRLIEMYSSPAISAEGFYYGRVWQFHDITEQVVVEQEIRALNQALERRVVERTQILEAVVKELEAFSYSVSHDLRAPLRAIDGFTRLLEQKYADRFDDTGRNYLQRVMRGSARMGELIDDMLFLSQVTRSDFSSTRVDIGEISRAILSDHMSTSPGRRVSMDIENGLIVQGDQRLLRIALENLFGNAWKFTAKCDNTEISVGTKITPHGRAIFIQDNGAGFDMRHADKMFQSFQRLHSDTEFEGTGIGLAIVQRIVNRHGGRIWAEGLVGVGATVYFII